jgi:hypothetical protein
VLAKLEDRRQELSNLCSDRREERLILTYGVGYVRRPVCSKLWPTLREVCGICCVAFQCQVGGFAQCEGPVELLRGKFQDIVAVRHCHSEDKIGISGNPRRELACNKVGCISTQLLEDAGSVRLDGVSCHRVGAHARCSEVMKVVPRAVRNGESFGSRRTTKVSSADEQYVQSDSSYEVAPMTSAEHGLRHFRRKDAACRLPVTSS